MDRRPANLAHSACRISENMYCFQFIVRLLIAKNLTSHGAAIAPKAANRLCTMDRTDRLWIFRD